MKELNEIDLLLQSAFEGLELPLDPRMKENIDRAIASKKKRKRFLFILFPILSTLAFGILLQLFSGSKEQSLSISNENGNPSINTFNLKKEKKQVQSWIQSNQYNKIAENQTLKNHLEFKSSNTTFTNQRIPSKFKTVYANQLNESTEDSMEMGDPPASKQSIQLLPEKNKPQSELITMNTDSTDSLSNQPEDSIKHSDITETIALLNTEEASDKKAKKWSLYLMSYWEGEKKRSAADFESEPFIGKKNERASIHSSTFYAKIEINRKLTSQLDVLAGIGFRSAKIIQYGHLSEIIIPTQDLGSGVLQPIAEPDKVFSTQVQSFHIHSVVLPIGLVYSFQLGKKTQLRLAGGGEFAYGQISSKHLQPELSAPRFRSFGCNIWLRPELHYAIGKVELFGFGTFNQSLSQQLQWDFKARRNPAFGVGIGARIQL